MCIACLEFQSGKLNITEATKTLDELFLSEKITLEHYYLSSIDMERVGFKKTERSSAPKIPCECGAEKVKSSRHSTWCPLHKKVDL